jgi:uncharacterized OB-fold protein
MSSGGVARFWREIPQRYNLIGNKCSSCNKTFFPPKEACPFCRRKSIGKMKDLILKGYGEIITYSIIYTSTENFQNQVPYIIAIIRLDEGPNITAQIVDCEISDVKIGMRVEKSFRKIQEDGYTGAIYYGYKFKPCDSLISENEKCKCDTK